MISEIGYKLKYMQLLMTLYANLLPCERVDKDTTAKGLRVMEFY